MHEILTHLVSDACLHPIAGCTVVDARVEIHVAGVDASDEHVTISVDVVRGVRCDGEEAVLAPSYTGFRVTGGRTLQPGNSMQVLRVHNDHIRL